MLPLQPSLLYIRRGYDCEPSVQRRVENRPASEEFAEMVRITRLLGQSARDVLGIGLAAGAVVGDIGEGDDGGLEEGVEERIKVLRGCWVFAGCACPFSTAFNGDLADKHGHDDEPIYNFGYFF